LDCTVELALKSWPRATGCGITILYRKLTIVPLPDKPTRCLIFRMYPYALISAEFPASKPRTMLAPTVAKMVGAGNQLLYRGIISALVLPSLDIPYVGLLPVRLRRPQSKLMEVFYPLCAQCAKDGIHGCHRMHVCAHSVAKRALRGCWTSLELQFALDHGYQILEVYQVRSVSLFVRVSSAVDGRFVLTETDVNRSCTLTCSATICSSSIYRISPSRRL
jgi:hypothetical protein